MASAKAVGIGASPEVIAGPSIIVRNTFGDPVVLVVELSPNTQAIYNVTDPEFGSQLRRYGVTDTAEVQDVHL